jgi:hypothetical protein
MTLEDPEVLEHPDYARALKAGLDERQAYRWVLYHQLKGKSGITLREAVRQVRARG